VNYLGYVLSQDGVSASEDEVKAVKNYPTPRNVRDVRAFLGLASFYRRLVPEFEKISKPLTTLIRKNQDFLWGPNQQEAFDNLKNRLFTTPVLTLPDFSRPFFLTTDASKIAVAAVLSQVQNGVERPIAYASRQLNKSEQNYFVSEAELLAVVWSAKFFRCYLFGRHFVVRTDHAALTYLWKFSDQNARLARWALKSSELNFSTEHRAGSKISHVDAVSRHVATVHYQETLDPEMVLHEQARDKFYVSLKPGSYASKRQFFFDEEGLIFRCRADGKHRLVVPKSLVVRVIRENHNPLFTAHPGIKRTGDLIALRCWWSGMCKSVEEFITECDACQRRKEAREFIAPLGEVEEPTALFQVTSMDITGPHPVYPRRNRYLLTFIDHFKKYAEAFPIADQTSQICARVYVSQIVARHGSGSKLITDQGAAFMSSFFNETCKLLGLKSSRTTSYHPNSNGVIERLHRTLHAGLSHYIIAANNNWEELVPFFIMSYRAIPHSRTGYSPFFLLHGREMSIPSSEELKAKTPYVEVDLKRWMEKLQASLRRAYKTVSEANRK
jgi:transposase InsO family protein